MADEPFFGCASVQGASHKRLGKPNQDYVRAVKAKGGCYILALSDGHGGEPYFRSDVGARFAVDIAISEMELCYQSIFQDLSLSLKKGKDEESRKVEVGHANRLINEPLLFNLKQTIADKWRKTVLDDLRQFPIQGKIVTDLSVSPDSKKSLSEQRFYFHMKTADGEKDQEVSLKTLRRILRDNAVAYGCTLLCLAISDKGWIALQIGDGDIRITRSDGKAFDPITPIGSEQFGDETHSLCEEDALANITCVCSDDSDVKCAILSCDGVGNSIVNASDFDNLGNLLLKAASLRGSEFQDYLKNNFLCYLTENGCGDDTSLCYYFQDFHLEESKEETEKDKTSVADEENSQK
jgi:hypothetical protein